jgi:AcrR family transcriptional regulator
MGGLRRLPPGRHGLPREFVVQNQRERLAAGTIAAVAEHGYRDTTITQIAAAGGISRRTFYSYFTSKDECFFETYQLLEEHLFAAVEEADGEAARGWPAQVRARVSALLGFFAANTDLIRFSLLAPPAAGGEIAERQRQFLERAIGALVAGRPEGSGYAEATAVELGTMAGGLSALLVARVATDGDGENLDQAAPEIVEMVLAPFLGRRRATAEARKPEDRTATEEP